MTFGRKPGYTGSAVSGMYRKTSTRSGSGTLATTSGVYTTVTDTLMATSNIDELTPSVTWDSTNDRWNINETGLYRLNSEIDWASGPTSGYHMARCVIGGSSSLYVWQAITDIIPFTSGSASDIVDMTLALLAGSTAQLQGRQTSGSGVNITYADYTITRCD